jgi:hypothetical protein
MSMLGNLVKQGAGVAVDIAKSVVEFATGMAAGMWKTAFGEETGAIVDPVAGAVNKAAGVAGGVAQGAANALVDVGENLIASIGQFSPPSTPVQLPPPSKGQSV